MTSSKNGRLFWLVSIGTVASSSFATTTLKKVERAFLGVNSSCAQLNNGDIKCWGRNENRHLVGHVAYKESVGCAYPQYALWD